MSKTYAPLSLEERALIQVWLDKTWLGMVRLAGIEPTTLGFGGQYSIH